MKRIVLLATVMLCASPFIWAQVIPSSVQTPMADKRQGSQPYRSFEGRSATKTVRDTILYAYSKRTSNRGIFINPSTSASAVGQTYEVTAPVLVSGFEFFAYVENPASTTPVDLICSVYPLTGGLPSGNPIVQTTVRVRSNSNTSLTANRQEAVFPNPVVVSGPFAVVVENPINENVTLFSNNWDNNDGLGEFLPVLNIGSNWLRASSVNVGGAPFDADFFLHPFVSYDFQHGFVMDNRCLDGNDTIAFTNTTATVYLTNRFLNRAIFDGTPEETLVAYDFSNGQGRVYRNDTAVIYALPQKYVIEQEVEHNLWTDGRPFIFKDSIDVPPIADFTFNQQGYRVNFINSSTGVDDIVWSFGDSIYSTLLNPNYRYLRTGTFDITLVVTNGCGSDTATAQITVSPNSVNHPEQYKWQIGPNPASGITYVNWQSDHPVEYAQLLDLQGRLLRTWSTQPGQQQLPVSLEDLPAGLYLLHLFNDNDEYATVKLTKQ